MKSYPALLIVFFLFAASCNKDKFTTVPQLEIKSISPNTVEHGDILQMRGEFTDEEGDLDSALIIYKWYDGAIGILPFDTSRYSFQSLDLPTSVREAEITLAFQYNTAVPNGIVPLQGVPKDTTATFGLILIDKEGNRSNYAESDQIRLIKP